MPYDGNNTPIVHTPAETVWQISSSADADTLVLIPHGLNRDNPAGSDLTWPDVRYWFVPTNAQAAVAASHLSIVQVGNLQLRKTVTAGTAGALWLVYVSRDLPEVDIGAPLSEKRRALLLAAIVASQEALRR